MEVKRCSELKYVLEQITAKSLLKLKELEVENCRNLEAIYLTNEEEQDIIDFPQLSHLKLSKLKNLTSFGSKFTSESTLFGEQVIFRALERLDINNIEKLEKIWHVHTLVESFFKLKVLKLTKCSELLVVFPPQATSYLQNLEEICIENCDKLETLVRSDDVPLTVGDEMILFPQLLTLKLVNLAKFTVILSTTSQNIFQTTVDDKSIVGKTSGEQNFDKVIEFPKLHTLRLNNLPRLTGIMTKVSFGRLSYLELERVDLIEEIWHCDHPATIVGELHVLEVKCCDKLLKIFPSHLLAGLQNLKNLHIQSCASLEHVFAVEDHPPFLSNLKHLLLENLPKLKQLWWNENICESFGLPSLLSFWMGYCPTLQYVFDASVANHLENLRSLYVGNCSSIVEIVEEKSGRKMAFPLLDKLELDNLPCFKGLNQYVEFPQVEYVVVYNCLNINEMYRVNVGRVRNIQLQGSMSFFESVVECWKTSRLLADAQ